MDFTASLVLIAFLSHRSAAHIQLSIACAAERLYLHLDILPVNPSAEMIIKARINQAFDWSFDDQLNVFLTLHIPGYRIYLSERGVAPTTASFSF